jgi:hypothetical protein
MIGNALCIGAGDCAAVRLTQRTGDLLSGAQASLEV